MIIHVKKNLCHEFAKNENVYFVHTMNIFGYVWLILSKGN